MENQRTFASMAWNGKGKVTRRERFLAEMEAVIPRPRLVRLIEPHYPKAGQGRRPLGLEKMLRIYFLHQWFNLSDPQAEDAIYDVSRCGAFVGSSWATRWCRTRPRFCTDRCQRNGHHSAAGSAAWAGAGAVRRSSVLEGRRSQVSPGLGRALPDQPAPHLPAALERARADDQPDALADPGARRTRLSGSQATVGLR
jgi:hypothetical protein